MKVSKSKLSLPEMIDALRKENLENERKPPTYEIEYRRLLQWLFEKHLEAEEIPETWESGRDGGGERGKFEREYQAEYRARLRELKARYGVT